MTTRENAGTGDLVRSRLRRGRRPRAALGAVLLLALAACAPLRRSTNESHGSTPPPPEFASVTAPIDGRGASELAMLEGGAQLDGSRLRQAYIRQENREYGESIAILNQVLYDPDGIDPQVEGIARWLRARAFQRGGQIEKVEFELSQAERLAGDPALRSAIATLRSELPSTASPPLVAATTVAPYPRGSWQAASANRRRMQRMGRISRITIHHSASVVAGSREAAAIGAIRGIQRYHQNERGWGDIGYHFLIDPAGRVWIGRSLAWQGAHAGDGEKNRGNIGICLLGNFMPSAQGRPADVQLEAMNSLVRSLSGRYGIEPGAVYTHRELRDTTCPGPYLQVAVQQLRARLSAERVTARP